MNVADRAAQVRGTAVISLSQRRAIRSAHQLPNEIRSLLPRAGIRSNAPGVKVLIKKITADSAGVALMHSGQMPDRSGQIRYWSTVFFGNRKPITYLGNRWTPTACGCSVKAGLCASADELGEIHVWSMKTGKRIKILTPVNHGLYHVQWKPDESGVDLACRYFSSDKSDRKNFSFNQYGPITHEFDFAGWRLQKVQDHEGDYATELMMTDPSTRQEVELINIGNEDIVLIKDQQRIKLLERERNANTQRSETARKWGAPNCLQLLDSSNKGRLPFIMGTKNGSLLQFSIETVGGLDRLKLQRRFVGHEAKVTSVSISPSGKLMASVSMDGTMRIWRLDPPRTLGDIDFQTDGTRVVYLPANSPAARAGLQIGDAIVRFDDGAFYERTQKIQKGVYQAGDTVSITAIRKVGFNGQESNQAIDMDIVLAPAPDIQEPILNLFLAKGKTGDSWVAWNQCGYYNASPGGSRHVGWHVNQGRAQAADFSRVRQFEKLLYRPDIVGRVTENWTSDCHIAEPADQLPDESGQFSILESPPSTKESYAKKRPPKITVRKPFGSTVTSKDSVQIEFDLLTPSHLPITELAVYRNGNEQPTTPVPTTSANDGELLTTSYQVKVDLLSGDNTIVVRAKHAAASSNEPEILVRKSSESIEVDLKGRLYVLAIGVSDYSDDQYDLDYADDDARDFAKLWKQQKGKMYRDVITKVITDGDATVDGILDSFDWLKKQKLNQNDSAFVFLAGHAFFNEDDIWVFASTELNPDRLTRTGIEDDRVNRLLQTELRRAGTVIGFFDTCHAGGVRASNNDSERVGSFHSRGRDVWRSSTKRIFASCTQKEESVEREEWENGAFTEGLISTINNPRSDSNQDGFIDAEELIMFTRNFVQEATGKEQTPTQTGATLNSGVANLAKTAE